MKQSHRTQAIAVTCSMNKNYALQAVNPHWTLRLLDTAVLPSKS